MLTLRDRCLPSPNRTRKKILSGEKADHRGGARATVNNWADPVVREGGESMLTELSILWEEGLRGKLLCASIKASIT